MMKRLLKNKRGVSVIEVLIALSIGGVIIASIGNLLSAINRLDTSSKLREQAVAYAKQDVEILTASQNEIFGCVLPSGVTGNCTKSGQTCTLLSGYTSCWIEFTSDPSQDYFLVPVGASWDLQAGQNLSTPPFTRVIHIANETDPAGTCPNYCNVKKVNVTISWQERGTPKDFSVSSILTGWKDL